MGTIAQSPLRSIAFTAPKATASSYFQGAWPTNPGTSHAKHTTRKRAAFSGVREPSYAMRPRRGSSMALMAGLRQKKQPEAAFLRERAKRLLRGLRPALAPVALLELVDAPGGVHHLLLAGVGGMRLGRDLDLVDRILLAVLPLDGLVGRDRGTGHEAEIATGVEEHDFAGIGVDAVFHDLRLVVGANSNSARETVIIPENMNESKGLLPSLVECQTLERTGFFGSAAFFHGIEEFVVVLCGTKLVEQEFGRLEIVHAEQELPQDPYLGKDLRSDQEFLAAGAGAVHAERGIEAFLGHAAVEVDLHVAGALEFLVDHVVHARARVDQRGGDDGERSALLDVPRRAEEALGALQRVGVHAAGEHLAGGGHHGVVGARQARDRVEQDHHVRLVLDQALG